MSNYHNYGENDSKASELDKLVKNKPVFARYHMTGCGHCVAMESEWDKLVNDMKNQKNIDIVNVEESSRSNISDELTKGISGFPTLVLYTKGGKNRVDYNGERTADGMKAWLGSQLPSSSNQNGGKRKSSKHRKPKTAKKLKTKRKTRNVRKTKKSRKHNVRRTRK
jgi:thiol-disulfide isomerase/thioredoxin